MPKICACPCYGEECDRVECPFQLAEDNVCLYESDDEGNDR
jgi:hypothetical protein